ncbi:MAG: hypothetical protein ACFCU5_14905 [Pleurocapsa sp.]
MMNIISNSAITYLLACVVLLSADAWLSQTMAEISVDTEHGRIEINNGEIKIDGRDIHELNTGSSQSNSTTSSSSSSNHSIQRSINTVYLSSYKLSEPHIFKLETSGDLSGYVVLDGKTIKEIDGSDFELDLSSYLSKGTHKLVIRIEPIGSGSSVSLQLNAPGNSINHNSGGTGTMEHVINLNVR